MRLLIHFARYGPYHHARLRAAHDALSPLGWEVIGLEIAGTDATYAWDEATGSASGPKVITAFPGRVYEEIQSSEYRRVLVPLLDSLKPDVIAIAGWASPDARFCLSWCRKNKRRQIVMSETREADGKRVWWKELAKRYLICRFDAALVGGKSQRDYLVKLGIPETKIQLGYNVVDNAYFSDLAADFTSQHSAFTPKYFLASNRFIERKNLTRLIEAYAIYGRAATAGHALISPEGEMTLNFPIHQSTTPLVTSGPTRRVSPTWPLCLLGDGELKSALIAQCHELGLHVAECAPWESSLPPDAPADHSHFARSGTSGPARRSSPTIYFPGFRQIDDLPHFYAHAGCFIHPALEEPWGLVINEAMACGLPVLSSHNVGAAEELVVDGLNGWNFDATDVGRLADLMSRISAPDFPLLTFGDASRRILEERCPTAAFGKGLAEILKR